MGFVSDFVGSITGAKQAAQAGQVAGQVQAQASEAGITETRRQFDTLVQLMAPFVTAGAQSLQAQQNLVGLGTPGAQAGAIAGLEASPEFRALMQQGETAILQNAAATGGLRGGNTQAALAQFRPALLSQLIEQQYGRLGGITQLGQASAAGQASAGMQSGQNIANLLAQQGAAQAGGILAAGGKQAQIFGDVMQTAGAVKGFCDPRLKRNARRIGTHHLGIGLYSWEYLWGAKGSGVMADELERIMPQAVSVHPSGYKMVNLSVVGV